MKTHSNSMRIYKTGKRKYGFLLHTEILTEIGKKCVTRANCRISLQNKIMEDFLIQDTKSKTHKEETDKYDHSES